MVECNSNVDVQPHPYISASQLPTFTGRLVTFVGRVARVDGNSLHLITNKGKSYQVNYLLIGM